MPRPLHVLLRPAPVAIFLFFTAVVAISLADLPTTQPSTAPSDSTVDWLMSQSTTAPAADSAEPATQPTLFAQRGKDASRKATLTLSSGQTLTGQFTTTPGEPIRVYDSDKNEFRDLPFKIIKSMEAHVLWERQQEEWKFKESGSDVKEFTGKTYPARETEYRITLTNGQTLTGSVAAPLYLQTPNGDHLYVLHKRDKGPVGQSLKDLVYIQKMEFAE